MRDQARERSLTGEESSHELPLEEADTGLHRGLGTLPSDKLEALLEVRTSVAGITCHSHIVQSYGGGRGLFEDPDFPADDRALFYSQRSEAELQSFTWARPHQLVERPAIFVDGTSRRDVIQVETNIVTIIMKKQKKNIICVRVCWATAGCCLPARRWPRRSHCYTESWTPARCSTVPAIQVILASDLSFWPIADVMMHRHGQTQPLEIRTLGHCLHR